MNPRQWLKQIQLKRIYANSQCFTPEQLGRRTLIVSPHFDDETLGCGGLMIRKKQANADVRIVFMTDGSMSHSHIIPAAQLSAMRRDEAVNAAEALGLHRGDVSYLNFPETHLKDHTDDAVQALVELLRRFDPEEVFLPYSAEPLLWSEDHLATTRITQQALAISGKKRWVYEYPIWLWYSFPWVGLTPESWSNRRQIVRISLNSWAGIGFPQAFNYSIDIQDVAVKKRDALERHRSQMFRLMDGVEWPILGDVAGGEFLDCFFQPRELFHLAGTPE